MDELEVYKGCLIVKDPRSQLFYIYVLPSEIDSGSASTKEMAKIIIDCMD